VNDKCSFPVAVENHMAIPCQRRAVCWYVVGGERLARCARHDGPKVRALADEKGFARLPIEEAVVA
jgi:hypothetical protein